MFRTATLAIFGAILCGCAANLSVTYLTYPAGSPPSPDLKGYQKFKLASPLILIESIKGEKSGVPEVAFRTVPIEEPGGPTYAIIPETSFGVVSKVGLATRPNSMVAHEVTTEIEDKRVEFIKELGGVIVSGIALTAAAMAVPPLGYRVVVDLADALRSLKSRDAVEVKALAGNVLGPKNDAIKVVAVRLSPVSADAIDRGNFPYSDVQSVLFYSACRDATIEFSYQETTYVGTVRIPDPNFLQTVGLPKTGKVAFHDQCGVSVTHGKAVTATSLELLKTTIDQVKSVRDAQEKAAKPPAKK